ncbi:MAG: molecular chaperone TorD family protein [Bryobacterales bacterium]|nr:molecular chaperone TorD family protein [Bryobacterales bacterium]
MPDRPGLNVALAEECAAAGRALLAPSEGDAEYVRLFLSPEGAACPPWQSVYEVSEGESPRLMGPPHHGALGWYRRYGFAPVADTEPADHAGLLLLFYAKLLQQGEPEPVLRAFAAEHLHWLPRLGERLAEAARDEEYRQLAEFLREPRVD